MQNILLAIVDVDNDKLLEDFVQDMAVIEIERDTTDSSNAADPIMRHAIKSSSSRCVELLVARSLSTDTVEDCLVKTTDQDLYKSAVLAAEVGNANALDVILKTNHKIVESLDRKFLENHDHDMLIHVSAKSGAEGSVDCLELLLDNYGKNIEERNSKDETPLHVAALGR